MNMFVFVLVIGAIVCLVFLVVLFILDVMYRCGSKKAEKIIDKLLDVR